MPTPSSESPSPAQRPSGRLNAAISSAVVGLCSQHIGRGPTKARTTIDGNLVVVLLRDGMAAFMSINHSEPDVAAEIFVMDCAVEDGGA